MSTSARLAPPYTRTSPGNAATAAVSSTTFLASSAASSATSVFAGDEPASTYPTFCSLARDLPLRAPVSVLTTVTVVNSLVPLIFATVCHSSAATSSKVPAACRSCCWSFLSIGSVTWKV
uniref:Uncharacterized protein n=1 Tax=Arundo donax TaxID=35708 RepID=A0A0A9E3S7_ARUDO